MRESPDNSVDEFDDMIDDVQFWRQLPRVRDSILWLDVCGGIITSLIGLSYYIGAEARKQGFRGGDQRPPGRLEEWIRDVVSRYVCVNKFVEGIPPPEIPVSYTHLTLPTKRIV